MNWTPLPLLLLAAVSMPAAADGAESPTPDRRLYSHQHVSSDSRGFEMQTTVDIGKRIVHVKVTDVQSRIVLVGPPHCYEGENIQVYHHQGDKDVPVWGYAELPLCRYAPGGTGRSSGETEVQMDAALIDALCEPSIVKVEVFVNSDDGRVAHYLLSTGEIDITKEQKNP